MKVIAIDPGPTTGIAIGVNTAMNNAWEHQAFAKPDPEVLDWFSWYFKDGGIDLIVLEKFTISMQTIKKSRAGSQRTIEMCGVIKWLADKTSVRWVEQQPGDAMNFAKDNMLKAYGWYTPGADHARDASRHLLTYLAKNNLIPLDTIFQ